MVNVLLGPAGGCRAALRRVKSDPRRMVFVAISPVWRLAVGNRFSQKPYDPTNGACMRALFLILCAVVLSNCALLAVIPPAVQYASTALSVMSYVATGKGTSDHVLSVLTEKDCALHRFLMETEICTEEVIAVMVADTSRRVQ